MSEVFAKMSSKGQLTVPVSIRKVLKIKEGDYVAFNKTKDGFLMTKIVDCPEHICPVCDEVVSTSGNYTQIDGIMYHLECALSPKQSSSTDED